MKRVVFYDTSLAAIRDFPKAARREAGYQLDRVQHGLDPTDWKPMTMIGPGVREIRIKSHGQFRVIYLATLEEHIAVLHAFRKKSQKTNRIDLRRAKAAYKEAMIRNSS